MYRYGIPTTANDQFYWASSQRLARNAVGMLLAPGLRILVRDGRDGADEALIDMVDVEHLAKRFERLVIASGDGKFADVTAAAQCGGTARPPRHGDLRLLASAVPDGVHPRQAATAHR